MTRLNNWLCKTFDDDLKGYVTIGDVLNLLLVWVVHLIYLAVILLIVGFVLYCTYLIIFDNTFYNGNNLLTFKETIIGIAGLFGIIIISVFFISLIYVFVFIPISKLKIAKCELQNKEDK